MTFWFPLFRSKSILNTMENIFWESQRGGRIKGKPKRRYGRGCQVQSLKQIKWISWRGSSHSAGKRNGDGMAKQGDLDADLKLAETVNREFSRLLICSLYMGWDLGDQISPRDISALFVSAQPRTHFGLYFVMKFSIYHKDVDSFSFSCQILSEWWAGWRLEPLKINCPKPLTSSSYTVIRHLFYSPPGIPGLLRWPIFHQNHALLEFPGGQTPHGASSRTQGGHNLGIALVIHSCCDK